MHKTMDFFLKIQKKLSGKGNPSSHLPPLSLHHSTPCSFRWTRTL